VDADGVGGDDPSDAVAAPHPLADLRSGFDHMAGEGGADGEIFDLVFKRLEFGSSAGELVFVLVKDLLRDGVLAQEFGAARLVEPVQPDVGHRFEEAGAQGVVFQAEERLSGFDRLADIAETDDHPAFCFAGHQAAASRLDSADERNLLLQRLLEDVGDDYCGGRGILGGSGFQGSEQKESEKGEADEKG